MTSAELLPFLFRDVQISPERECILILYNELLNLICMYRNDVRDMLVTEIIEKYLRRNIKVPITVVQEKQR